MRFCHSSDTVFPIRCRRLPVIVSHSKVSLRATLSAAASQKQDAQTLRANEKMAGLGSLFGILEMHPSRPSEPPTWPAAVPPDW